MKTQASNRRPAWCTRLSSLAICILLAAGAAYGQDDPKPQSKACHDIAFRALDFWTGNWQVVWTTANGMSGTGENQVSNELDGCVIAEEYRDHTTSIIGRSWSQYDRQSGQWTMTWRDNRSGSFDAIGRRVGNAMIFDLQLNESERKRAAGDAGGTADLRIHLETVDADNVTWRFQSRKTGEAEWKDMTVSRYKRTTPAGASPAPRPKPAPRPGGTPE